MNNKKVIIVLFFVIVNMVCFSTFAIATDTLYENASFVSKFCKIPSALKVGAYSLNYGTYKGQSIEYAWDNKTGKVIKTSNEEITLKLNPNNTYEIGDKKYKFVVKGSNLVVPKFNNVQMLKAIGNNKILLQAGGGVELTYSCK